MRLPDREKDDILKRSALNGLRSKKKTIIVLIIQIALLAFVFFRHYTFSYELEFGDESLKVREDRSRITTPEFELGIEGIYGLTVGYDLASDEDGQVTLEMREVQEDRYAIDSEKAPLRSYNKSSDLRIYCRNTNIGAKVLISNTAPESNELKVNGIGIRYLNKKSALYYTLWLLLFLCVLDTILYILFNDEAYEIGISGRKLAIGLCAIILLSFLPMYVDYICMWIICRKGTIRISICSGYPA